MKKTLLFGLLSLLIGSLAHAQTPHICGMSTEDQWDNVPRLLSNLEDVANGMVATDRNNFQYIPIHFHLVGDNDGNGRARERAVLDQLCRLNQQYEPVGFRFYLSPHPQHGLFNKSINSNNVYANQTNSFLMQLRRHPNAIDVFVVNEAATNNNQPGIALAYYNIPQDWIVTRRDQLSAAPSNNTIAHEVGHFFSLNHTFFGWESGAFQPGSPGWPKAPTISPGGVPTERVNGINCTTAGDYICDTPPDYAFGYLQAGCANYNGGAQDPLGVPVNPQENNFMSYFSNCSAYQFTPNQILVMQADRAKPTRNYLNNNFTPLAESITSPADMLVSPVGGDTTVFFDEVVLNWNTVPGAEYYLVEVDIVATFSSGFAQTFVTTNTSVTVNGLQSNRLHHWRVRPFNAYATCATFRQSTFRTSALSGVAEPEGLKEWTVFPNPLTDQTAAQIQVRASNAFDARLTLRDMAGRMLYNEALAIRAGETQHNFGIGHLPNGLYILSLENAEGASVQKLVVNR